MMCVKLAFVEVGGISASCFQHGMNLCNWLQQMGLGGGMDESFEDPGSFDDDDCEEDGELDGGQLESMPAPDLSGLLSVSPLVRFDDSLLLFY
jgi:hypothetical protein